MKFGRACAADAPALAVLYEAAFGSAREAALVLAAVPPERCFVARENDTLCAMTFALPVAVRCGARSIPAAYLFAVATAQEHRGRGISTELLAYIRRTLSAEGIGVLLLRPASESLADFYAARGYRYISRLAHLDGGVAAAAGDAELTEIDPAEYFALRSELLRGSNFLLWDTEMLAMQHRFLRLYGGGFCALGDGVRRWGCAAWYQTDGLLDVQELLAPPERVAQAAGAFVERFSPARMSLRLEARRAACLGVQAQDFLMACGDLADGIDGLYAALVMD